MTPDKARALLEHGSSRDFLAHSILITEAYLAEHERAEKLEAERDRLARTLAVERGDESQAPEGWRSPIGDWYWGKDDDVGPFCAVIRGARARYRWIVVVAGQQKAEGTARTALEAMEAAGTAMASLTKVPSGDSEGVTDA